MKIISFIALLTLVYSSPQPSKLFHEHYEDFMEIIVKEVGPVLDQLYQQYTAFEEFQIGLDYLTSSRFKNLINVIEDLPEFRALVEFLESKNIDINYFINVVHDYVDGVQKRSMRQELSGRNFGSYLQDSIDLLPKEKLSALFEQKKAEDNDFKVAMESFYSDEWDQIFSALWQNEVFLQQVQVLEDHGIDVHLFLKEVKAVMGIGK